MKKHFNFCFCLLSLIFCGKISAQFCTGWEGTTVVLVEDGVCDYTPYLLVFEDNFNSNTLDRSTWEDSGQGNTNQFYTLDNAIVSPNVFYAPNGSSATGVCQITAKRETVVRNGITYYYTSSNMHTKYNFGYGKYEIRCRIPKGKGLFPAYWMYGQVGCGAAEIDVFEFWNEKNIWGAYDENKLSKIVNQHYYTWEKCPEVKHQCGGAYGWEYGTDYSQGYHTYTVYWDTYGIDWYIDNSLKTSATRFVNLSGQMVGCGGLNVFGTYVKNNWFPPANPVQIIANLAIQSGEDAPSDLTPFPSSLDIDYIKYYSQQGCAGNATYNNTSELGLNVRPDVFNYIAGTSITFANNIVIENKPLTISACSSINFQAGTTLSAGTDFKAEINLNNGCCNRSLVSESKADIDNRRDSILMAPLEIIDKKEESHNILVTPNPGYGMFTLSAEGKDLKDVYVYDVLGKIVYQNTNTKDIMFDIDITNYPKGIYLIKVVETDQVKTIKIINQ